MSFNVKVISTLNDKNAHVFSMFCDLRVTQMVHFRPKSFSCFRDVLDAYLLHHVNSKKSVLSEILLSDRFTKIPSDLKYYSHRLEQSLQQAKLFYSNRKLYTTLHKLINLVAQLNYVKITNQDFQQVCGLPFISLSHGMLWCTFSGRC